MRKHNFFCSLHKSSFAQVTCFRCAVPSTSFVLTSSWLCRRPQTDLNSGVYHFQFSLCLNGHKGKSTVFDLTNLYSDIYRSTCRQTLSWCLFCCLWSILSNWWFWNIYHYCFSEVRLFCQVVATAKNLGNSVV